ncbi:CAP domain-containing protein [Gemella cuniculi]|uniref:CAP domain-containing protein n=1 Tax=Gemella cuniculi TaxID=150240 RepID=UPI0003FD7A4B|nr:CAP domain-containing protein [Gemella cuniculi]
MKKSSLKVTGKVLTGLVLLTGVGAIPTNAVEVKNPAVDINVKNVKASVYEKNGHYYAKLVADKEVANVVARVTVDNKSEFIIKKDIVKAGEVVEYELNIKAEIPTKKLPHTAVKKETVKETSMVGGHKFNITVTYEVATPEVKELQKEKSKENGVKETQKQETPKPKQAPTEEKKATSTESKEQVQSDKKETTVQVEKKSEVKAEVKPTPVVKPAETPVGRTTFLKVPAMITRSTKAPTIMDNKVASAGVQRLETTTESKKVATTQQVSTKVQKSTITKPLTGTREEQIRQAFLNKVNQLRIANKLTPLRENAALNASTKARANTVIKSPLTASVHGKGGSLEKAAAARAGYPGAQHILYNVAVNTNSGTPDQVAQRLIDALYFEINNVTTAFPYGHRNTLLDPSATEVGVGVTIVGNRVSIVQHQNHSGAFQGKKPIPSVYLDGKRH